MKNQNILLSPLEEEKELKKSSRKITELISKSHTNMIDESEKMLAYSKSDMSKFVHLYKNSLNQGKRAYLLSSDLRLELLNHAHIQDKMHIYIKPL